MVGDGEEDQGSTGVGYNVGVRFVNADAERPGWSSTRGAMTIMNDEAGPEYHNEMGQAGPCDQTPAELEKLQESWMSDKNKGEVKKRLNALDQDALIKYNANQASRSEIREFMTDAISEEMDKYLAEKADEEAFHPEARVFNYASPEYGKPGSEKYKIGQLMALQLNQQHM